ncbi:MAG: type III pantothenate kinase [Cyclobacteriaceae bacterium]
MNLAVDIGNSVTKAGWFEQDHLREFQPAVNTDQLVHRIRERPPDRIIVSSVSAYADELKAAVDSTKFVVLGPETPLPFENTYRTPHTLGTDRIAAVAGAQSLFPDQNVLVIDAGTCVTYELLNEQGQYLGGLISPGLRMRWQAMHTFTARLPLVSLDLPQQSTDLPIIGKSTEGALQRGGLIGMAAENDQIIRRSADKYAALQIVTCGGDMDYLRPWILSEHKHVPELVLIGLNSIVQYEGS